MRNAALDVEQILDEAQAQAVKLQTEAEQSAKRSASEKIAAAHEQSSRMLEQAMKELNSEINGIMSSAGAKQQAAIEKLVSSLS